MNGRKARYLYAGVIILIVFAVLFLIFGRKSFSIINGIGVDEGQTLQKSPLSGIECQGAGQRPFAVMMSSDKEARPLSGIGEADMVFEMPVVENGFTRMMAVFQCGQPKEIGSVRSSRLDFVPLALGLNAIYAHFGGEHEVLEELNRGIIDNIDGLKYDGTIYYRKKNIPRPHNAFTNYDLLTKASKQLKYSLSDLEVISYQHEDDSQSGGEEQPPEIFNSGFQVKWSYKKETNSYFRIRAGKIEIDKNTGKQVEARNVVIMKTTWSPINKDYIRVKTIGLGRATFYKDGQLISGSWKKDNDKTKLYFYDQDGKEIKFAPGSIWIEIVT